MQSPDVLAPCRNFSSTLIVFGIGDGSVIRTINDDPLLRSKDIYAVAFPGETHAETTNTNMRCDTIIDWESAQEWMFRRFGAHADIIRLAGADLVETHPLAPEAESFRTTFLPRLHANLADRAWGLGNDINDTFMGLYHASLNAKTLLPSPSLGNVCGIFGNIPAISVGAGPSVKDHLDELRALQDKCIIVACDAVYPALIKEGIVAHFVTPLERLKQQAGLLACARGTRTIFAGIPACHPDSVSHFQERTLYIHAMDKLYDWLAPREDLRCLTGSSTGVLSFLVAASLTRGPVYLVGHDLAKGPNGTSHFDGCEFAAQAQAKETANSGSFGVNGYETRFIPGNDGGMVESIAWWDTFRLEISSQAKLIPGRVFNVNAHAGKYARIEHTSAAELPDAAALPPLPSIQIERIHHDRYDEWRARAALLLSDCDAFLSGMENYRQELAHAFSRSPDTWDLDAFMNRMDPEMGVSIGNKQAFSYFLRSAITNEQMYMSWKARSFRSKEQAYFHTMKSLDGLASALVNAVATLKPCMEDIARG